MREEIANHILRWNRNMGWTDAAAAVTQYGTLGYFRLLPRFVRPDVRSLLAHKDVTTSIAST